ncbi:MOXD1 like protein 1 [Atta colombica]|uniref:MOXD1 like protein 1 n=1 Tax=Atta colombica TaxID=520822 RepID=A0A195BIF4_9HYME|nr:MOXD1 like protein 1 [Atta colombica]
MPTLYRRASKYRPVISHTVILHKATIGCKMFRIYRVISRWKDLKFQFAADTNTWRLPDPIKLSISRPIARERVSGPTGPSFQRDLHGVERNAAPVIDISQDVEVISGTQNGNRTVVTFARKWKTCDHQDYELTSDTIKVLWALHKEDPILNTAVWHGQTRGGKTLRLKTAAAHSPPQENSDIRHWDVKLTRFEVTNTTNTVYWCKIFKPSLNKKHHMIGYTPLIEKGNEDLVHHIILYECTSPMLGKYTRMAGNHCYISAVPKEWNSCLQPILAWARGSKGEWMPEHVGIPIAEQSENSYYMLEVHYNNPMLKNVNDSSGVRLHLTEKLRPQEAGILVTGVAVSPLHLIPPQRKEYATVGYCTSACTQTMFPEDGINIVSVVLHSHLAGRRLGLKHIRKGKELPRIVQDNHYDFDYQQSYTLEKEVKVLPGDELAAECIYGTLDRKKPTFGGYAVTQEMCLAFAVYYPKTPLAACYSMTPVKHLFKILAVTNFRGMTMDYLETLFLTNGSELISPSTKQLPSHSKSTDEIDETIIKEAKSALIAMKDHIEESEDDNIFTRLIIEDPIEFRGRTFAEHMMLMQWKDDLLAKPVEYNLYHGEHMTFCRKRDDQLVLRPNILNFPNYTALPEINTCELKIPTHDLRPIDNPVRNCVGVWGTMWPPLISGELYIGLLIVSLACLTLGLVSRDREGHAGSLAGPELTHRAPHEVDACPNLNPFVKIPIAEQEKVTKPAINNHQMKSEFEAPMSRKSVFPRSLSLDRLSRSGLQETRERLSRNRDLRTVERLSRSTSRISNDESINRVRESRFRIAQSRDARNSFDLTTRVSRVRDLSNRATGRRSTKQNFERRLTDSANSRLENRRSIEQREFNEIARQQNRDRSVDRRDSLNLQRRTSDYRDRQSLPERRINRQESREVLVSGRREHRDLTRNRVPNYRSEIRERRSVERRMSIEHRDVERSDRREDNKNLLKSARFARGDIDRNNNIDRRNRERSLENRQALLDRVANQERRFELSIARNSRGNLVKSDDRRTLSRSMERSDVNNFNRKILSRRVRSVESNTEKSEERRLSSERRSLDRSMERREIAGHQNRFGDRKSVDRMSRASSENLRRERINRSQRIASRRENTAIRENYRMTQSRYNVEEIANRERRERFARSSRLVDRNSVDRREIAKIRDSRDYNHRSRDTATTERRGSTQEQREKTNRLYRSREEQRIVPQRSREAERHVSERRIPERRILERRITLDSAHLDSRRSSERRIDDSLKSREGSRLADHRRSERSLESRVSRGRILEKRSILDSRRSSERKISDNSRSNEKSRMQDHVERNSELRNSMLPMERKTNSKTASLENQALRSSETRREIRRFAERRIQSVKNRPVEFYERESIKHLRQRSARNIEDSSRVSSLRRVIHVPEQNREQRRMSAERTFTRTVDNERLFAKWERNLEDARIERNVKVRAKIIPNSIKGYEFFKYPMAYDLMRQAFIVALCTVYGFSLYNGKKSSLG